MRTKKFILPFIAFIFALVIGFNFFVERNMAYAEEPNTPDYTYLPSDLSLSYTSSGNYSIFNNGYSFVVYGTNLVKRNLALEVRWMNPDNISVDDMSLQLQYYNSYTGDFSCTGVSIDAGVMISGVLQEVGIFSSSLTPTDNFEYLVGNLYPIDISDLECEYINFVFNFEVQARSYFEFSFNDFVLNFISGYQAGYTSGYYNGYNDAKSEFYNSRYDAGYNAGFIEGSNNQFSFLSYFGAIIETPINAALSLFDFDFLGFNMRSFFLSVLTVSLIVLIIKFVLAR